MAKKRKNTTAGKVQASERKPFVPKLDLRPEIDEDDCGDDGLTVKQRLFVAAITGPARGNATKAAEMAGYRSDNRHALESTAYENLRKPEIQEAIALALARKRADPEWARASLIDLARSSMSNFVSIDAEGEPRLDFAKAAAAGAIGHIKEFTADVLPGQEGELAKVTRCKIKVHDRTAALALLLKLHGLVNDFDGPRGGDVPLEEHPAAGRVKAPSGTTPPDEQPGPVQDRPGGPAVGQDGVGEAKAD